MKKVVFNLLLLIATISTNAQTWQSVGVGSDDIILTLTANNDNMYVGGRFSKINNIPANNISVWNGIDWTSLGSGTDGYVDAITFYNGNLYIGGLFGVLQWKDAMWSAISDWYTYYSVMIVKSLIVYNNELLANGYDPRHYIWYIKKWNETSWSSTGNMEKMPIAIFTITDELYGCCQFYTDGVYSYRLSKWNGTAWEAMGELFNERVSSLIEYNGSLYAGGSFTEIGTASVNGIAKWNGTEWVALGDGINGTITTTCIYKNELYVAGNFTAADGKDAKRIAKWNGNAWSSVGDGFNNTVNTLAVYKNELFAGGNFTMSGVSAVNYIAKLDTSTTGISKLSSDFEVNIYPNPVSNYLSVSNIGAKCQITIFDLSGRIVLKKQNADDRIDVSNLATGIYTIKITEKSRVISKKFVKK